MGALGSLIYPWGFILQGIALWHFVKRRPETYWLYVILFLGPLGAAVYVAAEMIPDLGLLKGSFQGFGRRSRIGHGERRFAHSRRSDEESIRSPLQSASEKSIELVIAAGNEIPFELFMMLRSN